MQKLKVFQASTQKLISELQASPTAQISYQQNLAAHFDNLENCNRRNNIRLRGLPEAVRKQDLVPTLTKIFSLLLKKTEVKTFHSLET